MDHNAMLDVYAAGEIAGTAWTARWFVTADAPAATVTDHGCVVNEAALAALVGADRLAVTGSVHGAEVSHVLMPGTAIGSDAITTDRPGLALVTLAADCVPVVLAGVDVGLVAAVHCGWLGLASGVVHHSVGAMVERGASAITAVVGPSICLDCYPVPGERLERVRESISSSAAAAACFEDPPRLGVGLGVVQQLREMEVARIEVVPGCTAEDPRLFTYRGSGTADRHAMVIVGASNAA